MLDRFHHPAFRCGSIREPQPDRVSAHRGVAIVCDAVVLPLLAEEKDLNRDARDARVTMRAHASDGTERILEGGDLSAEDRSRLGDNAVIDHVRRHSPFAGDPGQCLIVQTHLMAGATKLFDQRETSRTPPQLPR